MAITSRTTSRISPEFPLGADPIIYHKTVQQNISVMAPPGYKPKHVPVVCNSDVKSAAHSLKWTSVIIGIISVPTLWSLGLLVFFLGYFGQRERKRSYTKFCFFGSVAAIIHSVIMIITFSLELNTALLSLSIFSLLATLVYACFAYNFKAKLEGFHKTHLRQ